MDGNQFDALVRSFGSRESRRRVVQALAASAAGLAAAAIGRTPAAAAPDPCSVYCSRQEPKGPAQAACKQACKRCNANTTRVCRQETGYTCCPVGQDCISGIICCEPNRAICDSDNGQVCCPDPNDTFCCQDPRTGRFVCPSALSCGPNKIRDGCACICDPNLPPCPEGEGRDPGDCQCNSCPGFVCGFGANFCDGGCICTSVLEGGSACAGFNCAGPCTSTAECEQRVGPGSICQAPGTGCCGQQCVTPCPFTGGDGGDGGAGGGVGIEGSAVTGSNLRPASQAQRQSPRKAKRSQAKRSPKNRRSRQRR